MRPSVKFILESCLSLLRTFCILKPCTGEVIPPLPHLSYTMTFAISFKDFIILFCNVLLATSGHFLLRAGMRRVGRVESLSDAIPKLLHAFPNPFVIGGIAVFGFTTLVWLVILSRVNLSIAYPMIGLGYVLSIPFAHIFFKEQVTPFRIIGAILICIGVYFVAVGMNE